MRNLNSLQESHPQFTQLLTTHYYNIAVMNSTITCEAMPFIIKRPYLMTRHNCLIYNSFCMPYSRAVICVIYDYVLLLSLS